MPPAQFKINVPPSLSHISSTDDVPTIHVCMVNTESKEHRRTPWSLLNSCHHPFSTGEKKHLCDSSHICRRVNERLDGLCGRRCYWCWSAFDKPGHSCIVGWNCGNAMISTMKGVNCGGGLINQKCLIISSASWCTWGYSKLSVVLVVANNCLYFRYLWLQYYLQPLGL